MDMTPHSVTIHSLKMIPKKMVLLGQHLHNSLCCLHTKQNCCPFAVWLWRTPILSQDDGV